MTPKSWNTDVPIARSWIAVCMILVTCAWAAWLFGAVDWATAQKESVSADHAPDTAALSLFSVAESAEKTMRSYLQAAEQFSASSSAGDPSSAGQRRPGLFGTTGRSTADLEIIYVDAPKIQEKPAFPVDRFKLTGVMLGPDPRAFVLDSVENRTRSLRMGDRIDDGTVTRIDEGGISVKGNFGTVTLKRNP